jgi:small GTP-binding protein
MAAAAVATTSSSSPRVVMLIGDSNVGKTSMTRLYAYGVGIGQQQAPATILMDIAFKTQQLSDGTMVPLAIWDTAGAERFKSFLATYMRRLEAAILVFAADNIDSMQHVSVWRSLVESALAEQPQRRHDVIWALAVNKIDAMQDDGMLFDRVVRGAKALTTLYPDMGKAHFTSVSTGVGLNELFMDVATRLWQQQQQQQQRRKKRIRRKRINQCDDDDDDDDDTAAVVVVAGINIEDTNNSKKSKGLYGFC